MCTDSKRWLRNLPKSPEARLVQVGLLPVWVKAQLGSPWTPVPPLEILWFQNLFRKP